MTDDAHDPADKCGLPPVPIGRSISHMFHRKADKPKTKAELNEMLKQAVTNTAKPRNRKK